LLWVFGAGLETGHAADQGVALAGAEVAAFGRGGGGAHYGVVEEEGAFEHGGEVEECKAAAGDEIEEGGRAAGWGCLVGVCFCSVLLLRREGGGLTAGV